MAWEIEVFDEFEKGDLKGLVRRAESYLSELGVEEAVKRAIDEGCVYNRTLLEVVQYYGFTSEAFDLAYESLFIDMCERLGE